MDTNKNIVIGEWFCADLGIAIAERFHVYYYEEYDNIPEGKKLEITDSRRWSISSSAIIMASQQDATGLKNVI